MRCEGLAWRECKWGAGKEDEDDEEERTLNTPRTVFLVDRERMHRHTKHMLVTFMARVMHTVDRR